MRQIRRVRRSRGKRGARAVYEHAAAARIEVGDRGPFRDDDADRARPVTRCLRLLDPWNSREVLFERVKVGKGESLTLTGAPDLFQGTRIDVRCASHAHLGNLELREKRQGEQRENDKRRDRADGESKPVPALLPRLPPHATREPLPCIDNRPFRGSRSGRRVGTNGSLFFLPTVAERTPGLWDLAALCLLIPRAFGIHGRTRVCTRARLCHDSRLSGGFAGSFGARVRRGLRTWTG